MSCWEATRRPQLEVEPELGPRPGGEEPGVSSGWKFPQILGQANSPDLSESRSTKAENES